MVLTYGRNMLYCPYNQEADMADKIEPVLHVTYCVIAYDEGGYGDNRSREFQSGEEAVAYARNLEDRFGAQVFKRITMETISQKIFDYKDK
jgi:hypothetical protein